MLHWPQFNGFTNSFFCTAGQFGTEVRRDCGAMRFILALAPCVSALHLDKLDDGPEEILVRLLAGINSATATLRISSNRT